MDLVVEFSDVLHDGRIIDNQVYERLLRSKAFEFGMEIIIIERNSAEDVPATEMEDRRRYEGCILERSRVSFCRENVDNVPNDIVWKRCHLQKQLHHRYGLEGPGSIKSG